MGRVESANGSGNVGAGGSDGTHGSSRSSSGDDEDAGFDDTPTMRRQWRQQQQHQLELNSAPQGLCDTGTLPLGESQQLQNQEQGRQPQQQPPRSQRHRRRTRASLSSPASVSDMQYGALPLSRQEFMAGAAVPATAVPAAATQMDAAGCSGRAASAGSGGAGMCEQVGSQAGGSNGAARRTATAAVEVGDAMDMDGCDSEAGGDAGAPGGSGDAGHSAGAAGEAPVGTPERRSKRARTHPHQQAQPLQQPRQAEHQLGASAAAAEPGPGRSAAAAALGIARGLASRIAAAEAWRRTSATENAALLPAAVPSAAGPVASGPAGVTDAAPVGPPPLLAAARAAAETPALLPSQRTAAAGSPASPSPSPSQQPRRALLFRTRIGGPGSFGGAGSPAAAATAGAAASPAGPGAVRTASAAASPARAGASVGAGGSATQDARPGRAGSMGGSGLLLGSEGAAADRSPVVDAARGVGEVGLDPATVPLPWRRFSPASRGGQQPQQQPQQHPAGPTTGAGGVVAGVGTAAEGGPRADSLHQTAAGSGPGR